MSHYRYNCTTRICMKRSWYGKWTHYLPFWHINRYVWCMASFATNKRCCTKSFWPPQLLWVTRDYPAVDRLLIREIYIRDQEGSWYTRRLVIWHMIYAYLYPCGWVFMMIIMIMSMIMTSDGGGGAGGNGCGGGNGGDDDNGGGLNCFVLLGF